MTTFILALFMVGIDLWYLWRQYHRGEKAGWPLLIWIISTDLLPFILIIMTVSLNDNPTWLVKTDMWLIWLWMFSGFPRMAIYLSRLIGLKRIRWWVGGVVGLILIWGALFGRSNLVVRELPIESGRIPAAFDGYRIVQFSDLHLGTLAFQQRELNRLVNRINALNPDVVIFTGDLVNIRTSELDSLSQKLLQRIIAPVYSVTGNHDLGTYIRDSLRYPYPEQLRELIQKQRAMGWIVLEDSTAFLSRGNARISLTGISFDPILREHRHNRALPANNLGKAFCGIPDSIYNITAVHLPQLWEPIRAAGHADLTLAGHVHAMQLKIRFWGHGWSPATYFYSHWSGRYDEDGHTLYVNDGVGYVGYPMRLGARPEITLITLKRCK